MNELVSITWLNENWDDEDLILLDASIRSIAGEKQSSLQLKTIPGTRFFNLKEAFVDKNSPFPNTIPSKEQFEVECKKLGINKTSKIVVFDNLGVYSSPRVWWLFKIMGHDEVAVLDGGLPEWNRKGFSIEIIKPKKYKQGDFKATFQGHFVKSYQEMLDNLSLKSFVVVDARSETRFNGFEKEPRKHLKSGHIPNSINIPFRDLLENGKFKTKQELKEVFDEKCSRTNDFVFTCGSGITACIVMLACEIAYKQGKYVYDGSWSEWAELQGLIVNSD